MLSRTTRQLVRSARVVGGARLLRVATPLSVTALRHVSSNEGKVSSTRLFDEADPARDHMFSYSWGTWLKNDSAEKAKRFTKFSIQGLNDLFKRVHGIAKSDSSSDEIKIVDNCKILSNNAEFFLGKEGSLKDVKQIVSLHEGKHHRIYRIEIEGVEKKLILRLPYTLENEIFTKRKLESEVATMDFLSNALNLNIPKVLAYSGDSNNLIGHAFILMEYVEGIEGSLMKKWNPLIDSFENRIDAKEAIDSLNEVIEPIADFNKIISDFTFDNYGSIYFKGDCEEGMNKIAFENQDRWVIGPTTEAAYYRNKEGLEIEEINKFVGPWNGNEPLKMIDDLVQLELVNLKKQLSDKTAASTDEELRDAIKIFEKMTLISKKMFNIKEGETLLPNMKELLKPRLSIGDLDPMNVLVLKEGFKFLDFENCVIKPFLITGYPKFLEYNGNKIFDIEKEVENFEELDEIEKEQYKFIFKRTRNQFLWEVSINKNNKELVGVISPVIKLIRNCYFNVLNFKKNKDALYVENGLIEMGMMWDNYNSNGIVGEFKGEENPIKFSEEEIKEYDLKIREYENENSSTPFAATNGWVPQDMFERLQSQGMLVKSGDEWKIDTEAVLKENEGEKEGEAGKVE